MRLRYNLLMTVETIPAIEDMTPTQRIELMEALWKVMRRNSKEVESPEWHLRILDERERALANGETHFIDWEEAKADILSRTVDRSK